MLRSQLFKGLLTAICVCYFLPSMAQAKGGRYNVLDFGAANNDATVYSTEGIQKAIDKASKDGGGTVVVPKGVYLVAPIELKSNVELHLEKGSRLMASIDRLSYDLPRQRGVIWAREQKNIALTGEGEIDGRGRKLAENTIELIHKGVIQDYDFMAKQINDVYARGGSFEGPFPRPNEANRPMLIALLNCEKIVISDVFLTNSACWVTTFWECDDLLIEGIRVQSTDYWNNDGIDITDCTNVIIRDCDIDSADDGICLKSENREKYCDQILVENCRVRSSASAVKFGTASAGGFRNVTVRNIRVYDTFRSAVTIQTVDGGGIENIHVSNIFARNTGNAICLVIGERMRHYPTEAEFSFANPASTTLPEGTPKGWMKNVTIENLYCEVPATKPDEGYSTPGPEEGYPHNIFPSSVAGMKGQPIENVTLRNIEIVFPGGGSESVAQATLENLGEIMDSKSRNYPEFSMYGELPGWGVVVRYVDGIKLENVKLRLGKEDYRHALIFDKSQDIEIDNLRVYGEKKTPVVFNHVTPKRIKDIHSVDNTSGKMY